MCIYIYIIKRNKKKNDKEKENNDQQLSRRLRRQRICPKTAQKNIKSWRLKFPMSRHACSTAQIRIIAMGLRARMIAQASSSNRKHEATQGPCMVRLLTLLSYMLVVCLCVWTKILHVHAFDSIRILFSRGEIATSIIPLLCIYIYIYICICMYTYI